MNEKHASHNRYWRELFLVKLLFVLSAKERAQGLSQLGNSSTKPQKFSVFCPFKG